MPVDGNLRYRQAVLLRSEDEFHIERPSFCLHFIEQSTANWARKAFEPALTVLDAGKGREAHKCIERSTNEVSS